MIVADMAMNELAFHEVFLLNECEWQSAQTMQKRGFVCSKLTTSNAKKLSFLKQPLLQSVHRSITALCDQDPSRICWPA